MNIKIDKNGIWVSEAVKKNDGYIFCKWGDALMHHTHQANIVGEEFKAVGIYARH